MYRSIYVPVDNSPHSLAGLDIAIAIANKTGAPLTGSHVYAARLHDRRFRQMESGLPEPYLREDKLVEQRDIHDDLITRGLGIISESYLDVFSRRCEEAGAACRRVSLEGANWRRLVEDIAGGDCDLVVMGALGLGAVETSQLGSVCERVARRIDRDLLVVRQPEPRAEGAIVVALDGSLRSFGGLKTALELGRIFGRPVEAISAFDPFFHYVAFDRIAQVLSPQAASVFRFKEQEKLHEDIIDSGLAKIYRAHLDIAATIAREEGTEIATTLLAGKSFEQVLKYARERPPWLLVVGRTGVHSDEGMDLGSATENLLRQAPCNLLLSARTYQPRLEQVAETTMAWTEEAEARMARVPEFVRAMARKAVLKHALEAGHTMITSDAIDACLASLMPPRAKEAMAAMGGEGAGKCPFSHLGKNGAPKPHQAFDGKTIFWDNAALERLNAIRDQTARAHTKLRIEKMARRVGQDTVTESMVAAAGGAVSETTAASGRPVTAESEPLAWDEEAEKRVAQVPAGFVRDLTRLRIEAWARKHGYRVVTAEVVAAKLAEWEAGGSEYAPSLGWEDTALEKMKKMPPAIGAVVMQAVERYASEQGATKVTAALLQELLSELQAGRPFHQVGA
ncbi:MAG: universal stress protein [Betaproteobacteria bacterium]|nr:universal stress protein [Betaproteobacteria bacterium]